MIHLGEYDPKPEVSALLELGRVEEALKLPLPEGALAR
jgi:hypothetical protein